MLIYKSRYQAKKHASGTDVIVKVCSGGDKPGYTIISASDYAIWRRQK